MLSLPFLKDLTTEPRILLGGGNEKVVGRRDSGVRLSCNSKRPRLLINLENAETLMSSTVVLPLVPTTISVVHGNLMLRQVKSPSN